MRFARRNRVGYGFHGLQNRRQIEQLEPRCLMATVVADDLTALVDTTLSLAAAAAAEPGLMIALPANQSMVNPVYGSTFRSAVQGSSGNWDDPASWSTGRVPTASDLVIIEDGDTIVVRDTAAIAQAVGIYPGAKLRFATDRNTELKAVTVLVLGELEMGTETNPIALAVTSTLTIRDVAINPVTDPDQFGNGLIGLGKVRMHGSEKLSQVRLAGEPLAGQSVITLESAATGWRVGDKLIFPDSKQWAAAHGGANYASQYEEGTITAISADGKTISLAAPLQFTHPGARNGAGVLEFLPHVANRTRNVIVKSESGSGTRGYTLFTGRADVDIRYATFQTLGRTTLGATGPANVADRHPVTFAHLYGPTGGQANGYQYTFVGNSIFCGMPNHNIKWGLAINDSHYGLIQGNFLYNWHGAGVITISGNESYNVIEKNIVIRGRGIGDRAGGGDEGSAFWFRGPNNYVRDNVGANYVGGTIEAAYGFKYYMVYLNTIRVPNFRGASTQAAGEYTEVFGSSVPILEFARNEAYGVESGLTFWWVNTFGHGYPENGGESVIKDFKVWNHYLYGIYGYEVNNFKIDGLKVRGTGGAGVGLFIGDYYSKDFVLSNADMQGLQTGILRPSTATAGTTFTIRDSYFQSEVGVSVGTLYTSAYRSDNLAARRIEIRNVKFDPIPNRPHTSISMDWYQNSNVNLIQLDQVFVYDYNQIPGSNFQVYYSQQHADFVVPQSIVNAWDGTLQVAGSPVAGLTNQQNWQQYGIALAGAVAPATATTRAEIRGLVQTLVGPPDTTAPSQPANFTANAVSAGQINLSWAAAADNVAVVGYRIYRNGSQIGTTTGTSYANLGLAAGTTYAYTIAAYDAAGNVSSLSSAANATTHGPPTDTTPPTISGVAASNLTATAVTIGWATNEAADTQVEYGLTTSYGSSTSLNAALLTSHAASLTGLTPGQTYHYRLKSRDAAGNLQVSGNLTFVTPLTIRQITDDGSAGTTRTGKWQRVSGKGYENDIVTVAKGNGSAVATWTFSNLENGNYQIWTTWKIAKTNATNAPFTIFDGGTSRTTARVNQRLTPAGLSADGAGWKLLGTVTINSGRLTVKLTNAANGQVVGDAVRIERIVPAPVIPQPEISLSSSGAAIVAGQGAVNFGSAELGTPQTRSITVTNLGSASLNLTAVNSSGLPAGFSLVQNLGTNSLAAGASASFTLQLDASAAGSFGGWISLHSNDSDESPFWFQVTGTVADPAAPHRQTIDDGAAGHSLVGAWTRNASKGHSGDMLTAQGGTGSIQSKWTFANVPDGTYQIWATWKIASVNATNAPFTLYDGARAITTVRKSQRQSPAVSDGTTMWTSLGTINVTSGKIVVKLTNAANGQVVADAIRIERVTTGNIAAAFMPLDPSAIIPPASTPPAPQPSDVSWSANESTDYRPEAKLLDDAIDLLNSARLASGRDDSIHLLAADEIAREALLSVL